MAGARDEHAEVFGKAGLGLSPPPPPPPPPPLTCYMKIFASFPKIMVIDITEMTYRTSVCETCDLCLFLEAKVQPLNLGP